MVEETVVTAGKGKSTKTAHEKAVPASFSEISLEKEERMQTHIEELNRVLGGGLVPGSLTLVGGDPGIGKSTLLLQVCREMSADGHKVLYISGEESLKQIKLRANRIGEFSDNMRLLCETNLEIIEETLEREKPEIVVVDRTRRCTGKRTAAPGSVSQVREATGVFRVLRRASIFPS